MDPTLLLSYGKRRIAGPTALSSLNPRVCPLRGDELVKPLSGGYYVVICDLCGVCWGE